MGCPVTTGPATAVTEVKRGLDEIREYADEAFGTAQGFIDQLSSFEVAPVNFNIAFQDPGLSAQFQRPERPEDPDLAFGPVNANVPAPVLQSVPAIDVGDAPQLTATPYTPNYSSKPSPLTATAPTDAPTLSDVTLPVAPNYALPSVPTLYELNLPAPPTEDFPLFDGVRPIFTGDAPDNTFQFTEATYSSAQLEAIKARVSAMLAGGTGLPAEVEQALFDRARVREDMTAKKALQEALEEWSGRGFSMPGGELVARIDEVRQRNQSAVNTLSREILIRAHEVEIENLRFAVTQGIALENMLSQLHNQVMQRAFDVARYTLEAGINIFNARVTLYNAQLQAYTTDAQVFQSLIQAELLKLQAYRDKLEAQRIIGELNQQQVQLYSEQLRGVLTQVEVYKAELDGVRTQVEVDRGRVDVFRSLVAAYAEQVGAKKAEFDAWATEIQGETAKVGVFETEVRAFAELVRAYSAKVQAQSTAAGLTVQVNEMEIRKFAALLDRVKTELQAEVSRIQSGATVYEAKSRMYAAEGTLAQAEASIANQQYGLALESVKAQADLNLKQAELNITQVQRAAQLTLTALQGASQAAAQLAASALSALNIQASISSNDSVSSGCTTSYHGNI